MGQFFSFQRNSNSDERYAANITYSEQIARLRDAGIISEKDRLSIVRTSNSEQKQVLIEAAIVTENNIIKGLEKGWITPADALSLRSIDLKSRERMSIWALTAAEDMEHALANKEISQADVAEILLEKDFNKRLKLAWGVIQSNSDIKYGLQYGRMSKADAEKIESAHVSERKELCRLSLECEKSIVKALENGLISKEEAKTVRQIEDIHIRYHQAKSAIYAEENLRNSLGRGYISEADAKTIREIADIEERSTAAMWAFWAGEKIFAGLKHKQIKEEEATAILAIPDFQKRASDASSLCHGEFLMEGGEEQRFLFKEDIEKLRKITDVQQRHEKIEALLLERGGSHYLDIITFPDLHGRSIKR